MSSGRPGKSTGSPVSAFRVACLVPVLVWAACGPKSGSDTLEHGHPRMQEAARLIQQQDLEGALAIYARLLRQNPEFASAHLQMGMAYQTLRDPVAAAYHFRRYLEQRPEGAKAEIVVQMMQSELIRLVDQHPAIRAMQPPDVLELQDEISRLREQLQQAQLQRSRLELEARQARLKSDSIPATPAVVPVEAPPRMQAVQEEPPHLLTPSVEELTRTYVVRPGDHLSAISQRMYNTPHRWREILDANREILPTERSLRPGQTLIIP